jgi:hypothetical protein
MLTKNYKQISEKILEMIGTPESWLDFFNTFEDPEDKIIAYYSAGLKFPEDLASILRAYNGFEYEPVIEIPTVRAPRTLRTPSTKTKILIKVVNTVSNLELEVALSDLTKENATGIVFTKAEKDRINYYGKTVHGWKKVTSEE